MKYNIFFFSDSEKTIRNYRSELMYLISQNNFEVNIASLSNLHLRFLRLLSCSLVISSNMRANFFSLVFFYFKKKIIIVNGLGRLRKISLLRKVFFSLLLYSFRTKIIVQNYRDYRWLKINKIECIFIMGSGGRKFNSSDNEKDWIVISRFSKIKAQEKSISSFISLFLKNLDKVIFYGLDSGECLNKKIQSRSVFEGFIDPKEFFLKSKNFFQPDGYAEGFPHTLADAIASGCNICISHKQYIQLGIHKLRPEKTKKNSFIYFDSKKNDALSTALSSKIINKKYYSIILKILQQ